MYRVTVLTSGKYDNVALGARYCFTKRSARDLIDNFLEVNCEIEVEKFIRLCDDVFCWSDRADDKVLKHYEEKMWEV